MAEIKWERREGAYWCGPYRIRRTRTEGDPHPQWLTIDMQKREFLGLTDTLAEAKKKAEMHMIVEAQSDDRHYGQNGCGMNPHP